MDRGQARFAVGIGLLWLGYGVPILKTVVDFGFARVGSAPFGRGITDWKLATVALVFAVFWCGVSAWLIVRISKYEVWARNLYLALSLPTDLISVLTGVFRMVEGRELAGHLVNSPVAHRGDIPVGILGPVCTLAGLVVLFLPPASNMFEDARARRSAPADAAQTAGPSMGRGKRPGGKATRSDRMALALGLAPALPALTAAACAIIFVVRSRGALIVTGELAFLSSVVAYFAASVLGIPFYFLFEKLRWRNMFAYLAGGYLIGLLFSLVVKTVEISVIFGLYGGFAAGGFWLIARPDLSRD